MKVKECIDYVDRLKPNAYDEDLKYMWLNDVEKDIFDNVVMLAEPPKPPTQTDEEPDSPESEEENKPEDKNNAQDENKPEKLEFIPLVEGIDEERELTAQKPYETIYVYYLCAMIDYWNNEIAGYQNNMTLYNERYSGFAAEWRRKKMPKYSGRIVGL